MNIGRLGRKAFIVPLFVSYWIIALIILVTPTWLAIPIVGIYLAWVVLLYVGRLHDLGHSGWWSIFVLGCSVIGFLALAIWPGGKATNKYGEVPPSEISHLLHFWRAQKIV